MTGVDRSVRAVYLVALVVLAGLGSLTVGPGVAGAANAVGDCTTIAASGSYELTGDRSGTRTGGDSCIRIEASDVHLEGNGHNLTGGTGSDTVGVYATGSGLTNVTVANLTIRQYNNGTRFEGVDDGALENVTVDNQFVSVRLDTSTVTGTDVTIESGPTIDFDATNVLFYQPEPVPRPTGMAVAGQDQFSQLFVDGTSLSASADVTFHYDPAGLDESSVTLWQYDPISDAWLETFGASADRAANTVTLGLVPDTRYAVLGNVSSTGTGGTNTPSSGIDVDSDVSQEQLQQADASFGESIVTTTRGNVATIPIGLTDTDTATVTVGSADVNYRSDVTVTDGDGDGRVDLRSNTFATGVADVPTFTVLDGDDAVASVDTPIAVQSPLEAGEFSLSIAPGSDPASAEGASETDVGTMIVQDRSTGSITVRTAPGSRAGTIQEAGDVARLRSAGSLAPVSTVAAGDLVVHEVDVSGLEGLLAARRPSGGDATDAFLAAMETGDLAFDVEEADESAGPNAAPADLAIDGTTLTVVPDYANGTLYLVYDLSATNTPEAGDEYRSTFTVMATSGLTANPETFDETWTVEDRRIRLDTSGDLDGDGTRDDLLVQPSRVTLTGTSTLAPGSNPTLRIRSIGGISPFVKTVRVSIRPNGTFAAEMDFSDVPNGTEFTVSDSGGALEDTDGLVVEARADLDANADGEINVRAADGRTFPGNTTLYPGTELTVRVTGTDPGATFVEQLDAQVRADGTFVATGDFSDRTLGANYSVEVLHDGVEISPTYPGQFSGATVTFEDQLVSGSPVTVQSVTVSSDSRLSIHLGDREGILLGGTDLDAGSHSDVAVDVDERRLTSGYLVAVVDLPGGGPTVRDGARVTVNESPNADPGPDREHTLPPAASSDTVTLDGTASSDDVQITSYSWRVRYQNGSVKTRLSGPYPELDVSGQSNLTLELTVTDAGGRTDTATANLEVTTSHVELTDQQVSTGAGGAQEVTLGRAVVPERGFVAFHLHNATGQLVGSAGLTAGDHRDLNFRVGADIPAGESVEIVAVLYRDVDDDQRLHIPYDTDGDGDVEVPLETDSRGQVEFPDDEPFRDASGDRIADSASISAPAAEATPTEGDTGPGFTALAALVAVAAALALAARRH